MKLGFIKDPPAARTTTPPAKRRMNDSSENRRRMRMNRRRARRHQELAVDDLAHHVLRDPLQVGECGRLLSERLHSTTVPHGFTGRKSASVREQARNHTAPSGV